MAKVGFGRRQIIFIGVPWVFSGSGDRQVPYWSLSRDRVRQMRADGIGLLKIGRTLGIGTGLVQRLVLLKSPLAS